MRRRRDICKEWDEAQKILRVVDVLLGNIPIDATARGVIACRGIRPQG